MPMASLSLAEALGMQPPSAKAASPQPAAHNSIEVPSTTNLNAVCSPACPLLYFEIQLRKADGVDFGLNVSLQTNDNSLVVEGVILDGAVDAWNRQCAGT